MLPKMSSTRQAAGEAILELAREGVDLVALSADTSKSMFTDLLKEDFPDRFIDTGIAEQNMMMIAAGLAASGKTAFVASYSVFTSMRCCEQIRTFIAYPGLNVKIIAGLGGLSAGIEGVTHTATEDLGIMRCIPNMTILAPSDAITTRKAVRAAAARPGPAYVRIGREASPVLFDSGCNFEIGMPVVHKRGRDVTLVACGLVLAEAFEAVRLLSTEDILAGLIEVHTLKPVLSPQTILDEVFATQAVLTIEEHNILGGLGTVVSELLAGIGPIRFKRLGLSDCFSGCGTPDELRHKHGLTAPQIAREARDLVEGRTDSINHPSPRRGVSGNTVL